MMDSLPDLMKSVKGDERNVILTLARMWVTAVTGEFLPKDEAAKWAVPHLPTEQAALLDLAGRAYRGEYVDKWENMDAEVTELVYRLKKEIEYCLI
jgi:streptomycin 3"-adenylyltransferase